jgi:hypothetical protein
MLLFVDCGFQVKVLPDSCLEPNSVHQTPKKSYSGTGGPSGVLDTEVIVDRMTEFLLAAQVTLGRLNRCVAEQELDLLSSPPAKWHSRAQVRRKSCGARFLMTVRCAAAFTTCHIAFGVRPSPQSLPRRSTRQKTVPAVIPADAVQPSTVCFAHAGTGTVRICFPLPTKSAMTQCSSRILEVFNFEPDQFRPPASRIQSEPLESPCHVYLGDPQSANAAAEPCLRRRSASSQFLRPISSRLSPGGYRPPGRGSVGPCQKLRGRGAAPGPSES